MLQNRHTRLSPVKVDLNVLSALVTVRAYLFITALHEMLSTTSFAQVMSLNAEK
jgi:hypothetical protein